MKYQKDVGISEVIGALLLVTMLMTGMGIISVMLLSTPPPTTIQKAVLGIKCSWCPDLKQYDILIDHEGGENLSLSANAMKFSLFTEDSSIPFDSEDLFKYAMSDPKQTYFPPKACDDSRCDEIHCTKGTDGDFIPIFSTGESLKYVYKPTSSDGEPKPTQLLIQEPSSIGYVNLALLQINYIQNMTPYSSIGGAGGLPVSAGSDCLKPNIKKDTLTYGSDACEVDFVYENICPDQEIGWGSRGQPWNYVESLGLSTPTISNTISTFPQGTGLGPHVEFIGTVEYRLGYRSVQMTCDERIINMYKT